MAGKIFKYLPKSTSFSIPTKNNTNIHRANFSGPIVSIIPKEARRTKRSDDRNSGGFESQEPTSPKVTCMGQVKKHKKHEKKNKKKTEEEEELKKSGIRGMFQKKVRPGRPPVPETMMEKAPMMMRCATGRETAAQVAPEVGMLKKFASGRETLADFDWRKYAEEEEGEEAVIVMHSAPLVMGGGGEVEKRKEVNLWKRRTLAPPERLQLKSA